MVDTVEADRLVVLVSASGQANDIAGLRALRGVDFTMRPGEFVAVMGPSGCGKSTALRMLAGLEEITGGELSIDGIVVNDLPPHKRNVNTVFQNYALFPHMTVAENIGFHLKIKKIPKDERARRVLEAAKILDLDRVLVLILPLPIHPVDVGIPAALAVRQFAPHVDDRPVPRRRLDRLPSARFHISHERVLPARLCRKLCRASIVE